MISSENPLPQLHYFTANYIGQYIYIIGGCDQTDNTCNNDVYVYDTGVACPNDCSGNGQCSENKCVCKPSWFENDCSIGMGCPDNCNEQGMCLFDGTCGCYPGYTGNGCEIFVDCLHNCTAETNGKCLDNGDCFCFDAF